MTTSKKLSCPECGAKYATAKGMASHRRHEHGIAGSGKSTIAAREKKAAEMFKCPQCGETFPSNQKLGLHLRQKHGIQGTAQSTVAAQKKRYAYLANYKRGADGKLLCPECGKGFGAVGITFHRKQAHGVNAAVQMSMFEQAKAQPDESATNEAQTEGVKCEQCDFVAKDARGLRTHVSHIHQLSQTANAIYAREKRNKTIEQPTQVIVAVQTTSNGNSNREAHPIASGYSIPDQTLALALGRFQGFCQSFRLNSIYLQGCLPPGSQSLFTTRKYGRHLGLACVCPHCEDRPPKFVPSWNRWRWMSAHIAKHRGSAV